MTPYLAALDRRRHQRRPSTSSSIATIARAPSSPRIPRTNNSAKTKWRRRPTADSAGSSRSVCRSTRPGGSSRSPRAREGSEHELRGQILMIVQCRGRRSAARAMSKRPHCQCCRFSDLLSMTPYLAALDRRRHQRRHDRHHRIATTARAPSSPRIPRPTIPLKRNGDVATGDRAGSSRSAAAAPTRRARAGLRARVRAANMS